ncbi:MAG: hypothetical protein EKK39_04730 [Sphingobacteriales bacterium]|uniref:hypothetical protein n=1 Tax=Hydrotalea flava TaxID=714549 RepID=UPI00082D03C7|nr:hypothetical protein [Hydrotalea flava]RTL54239.1 MAG: hypothetical protein EKK39_04730 [Sphingobacteriales bacterium]
MKIYIYILPLLLLAQHCVGQSSFKRNDIYLEAGGNGLFISANYERQLTKEPGLGVRIGVGMYSENAYYLTIPIGINYLFATKNPKGFLDAGLGVSFTRENAKLFWEKTTPADDHFVNFIPSFGYRRHTTKNMMWRISCTPGINKFGFVPWIGFSIGKRF